MAGQQSLKLGMRVRIPLEPPLQIVHISTLRITQRNAKRSAQIAGMVKAIKLHQTLPKIELVETEDGFQIHNGHHRALAYFSAGVTELDQDQYTVLPLEPRPEFGTVSDLAAYALHS
jgi:hypothetical protein